ncbi:MAG: helix-turn-helix transcriptional regulator [Solirubrobacterales bacterium]
MAEWTFLTNHGHAIVMLARDPEARIRDIAQGIGITERAAQRIVNDLVEAGYLTRERVGRRNRYSIDPSVPLRHPLEQEHGVGDLLKAVAGGPPRGRG